MYILNQIWFGKFHYFGFKVKNFWGGGIFSLKKLKYHFAKYYYLSIKYHKTSIKTGFSIQKLFGIIIKSGLNVCI